MASTTCAAERLARLRAEAARQGLDGLILTTADAWQNEEPPAHGRGIEWLTGFTGSLAHAVVLPAQAVFLVDGRYGVQAARQVDGALWRIAHLHDAPVAQQLREAAAGGRIGFDPMCWTVAQIEAIRAGAVGVGLVAAHDPFAAVWDDRPAPPLAPLVALPDAATGRTASQKMAALAEALRARGADLWVETRPDNIAWMLNVRGGDVPMNPLPLSFAALDAGGRVDWFIDPRKLTVPLPQAVTARAVEDFLPWLAALGARRAAYDPAFTPQAVAEVLSGAGATGLPGRGLVTMAKAVKTPEELDGFRRAHRDDAIALARFAHWLHGVVAAGDPPDEWQAASRLAAFRAASPRYREPSFATVAASGVNAALPHYAPAPRAAARLSRGAVFLCDSGGQYDCGTTDVTRTHAFAPVPDDIRRIATAVLKGFIALSAARFPTGTFPHQIDALARVPLWAMGLDYDHGTGHDVGHGLLVHEHPHRIGKAANPFGLSAGNVLTLEPGFYHEGRWGIRIENQVEVVDAGGGFLAFAPLTWAPIDLSLFNPDALTPEERAWLNGYHAEVRERIAPHLPETVCNWLLAATEAV